MRVLTTSDDTLCSTELNTLSKDEIGPFRAVCGYTSDEIQMMQEITPRVTNSGQNSKRFDFNEPEDLLRVTVLYLEGITSSNIPSARISAWVGFRSSFPSHLMSSSSSSYSSYFLKEGNLLAVESDQMKWTPNHDHDEDSSPSHSGIAFWDSVDEKAAPHLDIEIHPQSRVHTTCEHDTILLPDILEFHVCIVTETSPRVENDTNTSKNSKWTRNRSSQSLNKWDNEMEEVHWYKDEQDDDLTPEVEEDAIQLSLEEQHQHGIAHFKVYHDPDDIPDGGKIVHLPIRMVQSDVSPRSSDELDVSLSEHAATLSIKVEKMKYPKDSQTEQIHYVKNTWNGGQECAPPSVKPNDESTKEDDPNDSSLAKHFRFDAIKSIIPGRKSDVLKSAPEEKREDPQPSSKDDDMSKIQEALESSFKSLNDSKRLAAAMKQQRQKVPVSPASGQAKLGQEQALLLDVSQLSKPEELVLEDGLNVSRLTTPDNDQLDLGTNKNVNPDNTTTQQNLYDNNVTSASLANLTEQGVEGQNTTSRQSDQIASPRNETMMQRLFCGANINFTDVLHHCDEEHVGMYVVDSMSLSSINT